MNATPQFMPDRLIILAITFLVCVVSGLVVWFLRRRFHYRVSTILWIITLTAVVLGWVVDRRQLAARLKKQEIELRLSQAQYKVLAKEAEVMRNMLEKESNSK